MTRIIGMINWYEESPEWLSATVASLHNVCEHIVACDGSYLLYPGSLEFPRSGCEQADAITQVAHALNIGVTIHRPRGAWIGNEVAKRNHLLELAKLEAGEQDWFLRIDADEAVTACPADIFARLEQSEQDVAACYFWKRNVLHPVPAGSAPYTAPYTAIEGHPLRVLFRNVPGLEVVGRHHYFRTGDGRYLAGYEREVDLDPELPILDFKIEHRHDYRLADRNHQAVRYYRLRDRLETERDPADTALAGR